MPANDNEIDVSASAVPDRPARKRQLSLAAVKRYVVLLMAASGFLAVYFITLIPEAVARQQHGLTALCVVIVLLVVASYAPALSGFQAARRFERSDDVALREKWHFEARAGFTYQLYALALLAVIWLCLFYLPVVAGMVDYSALAVITRPV